jgi:glutamate-1-semialdehyde aminotransferase
MTPSWSLASALRAADDAARPHLAMRGIYTAENMLFFISAAHDDDDLLAFDAAVKDSLIDMRQGGYFA